MVAVHRELVEAQPRARPTAYPGLATRAIAFAVDAAVVNAAAVAFAAVVVLGLAVVPVPDAVNTVAAALGAVLYGVWTVGYFVAFWSTTGQTPGGRLLRVRVVDAGGGERLRPRRALVRVVGLVLAALPLFAGFLLILVDPRRRGLQDVLARTVVVDAPERPSGLVRAPAV